MKDVFISHASEDKQELAEPIYHILTSLGKNVWLDKYELIAGKSLMGQIDDGLTTSRYGVLLITPSFMQKSWPKTELQALFSAMVAGEKQIVPVWHNVDQHQVREYSPLIADLVAITTNGKDIEDVALEILKVVAPNMAKGLMRAKIVTDNLANGEYKTLNQDDLSDLSKIKRGPVIHEELPPRVLSDAVLICEVFKEFAFMNLLEFLDSLSRDHRYDDELAIWHKMASVFHWATTTYKLKGVDERRQAMSLINWLSMVRELDDNQLNLSYLSAEMVDGIKKEWSGWPKRYLSDIDNDEVG